MLTVGFAALLEDRAHVLKDGGIRCVADEARTQAADHVVDQLANVFHAALRFLFKTHRLIGKATNDGLMTRLRLSFGGAISAFVEADHDG